MSKAEEIKRQGELAANLVGEVVLYQLPGKYKVGCQIAAVVVNTRYRYGDWDLQLIPLLGIGNIWTPMKNVTQTAEFDQSLSVAAAFNLEVRANECGSGAAPPT